LRITVLVETDIARLLLNIIVGVLHLATYIFLFIIILNQNWVPKIDSGMAFTPFPSSILNEIRTHNLKKFLQDSSPSGSNCNNEPESWMFHWSEVGVDIGVEVVVGFVSQSGIVYLKKISTT
jgi:hypothetical protein